jgi:uncharacterized protein (TIGR02594 family)
MILPKKYQWLQLEDAPRHLLKAVELFGTTEIVGPKNNPVIMDWAKETNLKQYTNDEIPWCGLYIAVVMKRANRDVVKDPLWARNWAKFGVEAKVPMLADVLVFQRETGGHVGFYVGEDKTSYHVLGGNQGNAVSIVRIAKDRLIASRRPPYTKQPLNVRKIKLDSTGTILSTNEA